MPTLLRDVGMAHTNAPSRRVAPRRIHAGRGLRALNVMNSEFDYIQEIRAQAKPFDRLSIPIGDDTACWDFPEPSRCLITTDMLLEGAHFTFPPATPQLAGRKALAVNLSDIAAMAGIPLAAFVSVAFPKNAAACGLATDVHTGLRELADEYNVAIAGGDTNSWDGPLIISVTLIGEATERGPVTRSGAKPGDWIMVTGKLGGTLADRHLTFPPRVSEALALHEAADLHAMIDLSDGLSSDLRHILEESKVGAEVHAASIPITETARNASDNRTPLDHALSDGEDFELLFTVSPDDGKRLLENSPIETPLSHIGTIVEGSRCEIIDETGERRELAAGGWRHSW